MQEKKLLSIIVPVYNTEKYLKECIESILDQTYKDFELILVNDGSKDNSGMICREYMQKDARVKYVYKENEGACYARRDGVLAAKGEYVGFVDSDDWIESDMYEELLVVAKKWQADIVTSGFIYDDNNCSETDFVREGVYESATLNELHKKMIFDEKANTGGVLVSVWNKIYKKDLILPYLEKMEENIQLWEDIGYVYPPFVDAKRIVITHKCYYHYRQNPESTTHKLDKEELKKTLYSLKKANVNYKKFSEEIQLGFYRKYAQIIYRYLWKCCTKKNNNKSYILSEFKKVLSDLESKQVISTVISAGNISEHNEEMFLSFLLDRRYEKAYRYCKRKSFALKLEEFIYYKIFRKIFNQTAIDFIKKRIVKNANE